MTSRCYNTRVGHDCAAGGAATPSRARTRPVRVATFELTPLRELVKPSFGQILYTRSDKEERQRTELLHRSRGESAMAY